MSIVALVFLLFLGITLVVYYVVPGRIQWWVLLAASIVFYACAAINCIPYIIASVIISYLAALLISNLFAIQKAGIAGMEKAEQKPFKAQMKKKRRHVLVLAVLVVISFLVFLKYYNFAADNINIILGLFHVKPMSNLSFLLPLGISFYTFQIIAYLVDIYRGKCEAQRNFAKYALYIFFFPQITEGPIARYDQLAPQLYAQRKVVYDNLRFGAQLMIWGFFKKLVIADRLALLVNTVYDSKTTYPGYVYVIATALFSIQMYADFSGCMDIITGAAQMFGIQMAKNFNHPYFAKTMPEFWRRWHISLCTWFKDYVFYPVSASRLSLKMNKSARKALGNTAGRVIASSFPVLVVWMLTGLWHGSHWNYVMWGLFHGVLIILGIVFVSFNLKMTKLLHIRTDCFSWRLYQMLRTFLLCSIARVFFRANNITDSFHIFSSTVHNWNVRMDIFSLGLDMKDFLVVIVSMLVLLVVSNLQEHMKIRETLAKQNLIFRWAVYFAAIFIVIIFGIYGSTSVKTFIYEKF